MFKLFIPYTLFMILTQGTKEIAHAMLEASDFLPLNDDDNVIDYLMEQDVTRLKRDIDTILALDPTHQVIPENESNVVNEDKQTMARLLLKFHQIIQRRVRVHELDVEINSEDQSLIDEFQSSDGQQWYQQYQPFPQPDAHLEEVPEDNQEIHKFQGLIDSNPSSEFPRNYEDEEKMIIRMGFDLWCTDDNACTRLYKLLMELSGETSVVSSSSLHKYQTIESWFRVQMGATLLRVYPLIEMLSTVIHISFLIELCTLKCIIQNATKS